MNNDGTFSVFVEVFLAKRGKNAKLIGYHDYLKLKKIDYAGVPDLTSKELLEYVKDKQTVNKEEIVGWYCKKNNIGQIECSKELSSPIQKEELRIEESRPVESEESTEGEAFEGFKRFVAKVRSIGMKKTSSSDRQNARRTFQDLNDDKIPAKDINRTFLDNLERFARELCLDVKKLEGIYKINIDNAKVKSMVAAPRGGSTEGNRLITDGLNALSRWEERNRDTKHSTPTDLETLKLLGEFMCELKSSQLYGKPYDFTSKKNAKKNTTTGKAQEESRDGEQDTTEEQSEEEKLHDELIEIYTKQQDEIKTLREMQETFKNSSFGNQSFKSRNYKTTKHSVDESTLDILQEKYDTINQLPISQRKEIVRLINSITEKVEFKRLDDVSKKVTESLLSQILYHIKRD